MGDKSRHPGRPGLVLALAPALVLALCLFVAGGNAVAAENAVRMPVEKGAAPDPLGELVKPRKAPEDKKPEAEAKHPGEKKAEPAPVARGEAKKSEPEAKKPEAKKQEPAKPEKKAEPRKAEPQKAPESAKPAAKPGKKPEQEKAASPAPEQKAEAPKPEKKPAAEKKPGPEKKAEALKPEAPKAEARPAAEKKAAPVKKPAAKTPAKPDPSANATQQLADAPAPAALKPAPKPEAAPAPTPTPAPAPAPKPEAKAAPEPAPKPVPVPKPVVDPVAFLMPAGPSNPAPAIDLPKEGLYVGDLRIEFQHTQIILRAATSEPVERVTTFYLKGPRRLALDLRGNWAKKGGTVVRYDTGPVKHIVVGEHPDRLRLTLEFREGAVRPDLDPAVVREPGGGVTATIPLAR